MRCRADPTVGRPIDPSLHDLAMLEEHMQSRTATIFISVIGIALVLSASRSASSGQQARKAPAPSENAPIVFEIIEKDARPHSSGDEYLYFRLYQSGTAEFEISPLSSASNDGLKLHRLRLNDDEQDELSSLAERCIDMPGDFDPMQRLEEKVVISTITIRDKDGDYHHRVIHRYRPENEKTSKYFPEAAKDLMQKANYLRRKYALEA